MHSDGPHMYTHTRAHTPHAHVLLAPTNHGDIGLDVGIRTLSTPYRSPQGEETSAIEYRDCRYCQRQQVLASAAASIHRSVNTPRHSQSGIHGLTATQRMVGNAFRGWGPLTPAHRRRQRPSLIATVCLQHHHGHRDGPPAHPAIQERHAIVNLSPPMEGDRPVGGPTIDRSTR